MAEWRQGELIGIKRNVNRLRWLNWSLWFSSPPCGDLAPLGATMLTWTTVKPRKPGWYWVRDSGELLTIVRLIPNPHGEFTVADDPTASSFLEDYTKIVNGRD